MQWGKRRFSLMDMLGDLVMHAWENRKQAALADLTRKLIKLSALALVLIALICVLYPTQREGWELWLGAERATLAHWTAVVLVGFTAICIPLNRYAWSNGGGDRPLAVGGGIVAGLMMIAVLLGTWNMYAATSSQAVGVAVSATTGAEARIKEAESAMAALEQRATNGLANIDKQIDMAPANAPTGKSRLAKERREAEAGYAAERARMQAELREARAAKTEVHQTLADPRPVDGFVAGLLGVDRQAVATSLDLFRSAVFESIALVFVALATTAAFSPSVAPSVQPAADAEPQGDEGLDDLRDEPVNFNTPQNDERRARAARKGWQARWLKQDDEQAPSDNDPRVPPEGANESVAKEPDNADDDAQVSPPELDPDGDGVGADAADAGRPRTADVGADDFTMERA